MTLKSFPRGGKKVTTKPRIGLPFIKKDASTKPRKNRGKKSSETEPTDEKKHYVADVAECLTYSNIGEGMNILGRIREVTEYDIIVSLPGRLSGRIEATDVSRSYTNLLRSIVNSEDSKMDEFKPLSELYTRGKFVVCYVKNIQPGENRRISLSLEPELINRNLDPTRLSKGSKILGTISSVEDHGYVLDTGIDNFRCFLGLKDIDDGVKYYPGKQLFCSVKNVKISENSTTAQITTKLKHVETAISNDEQSLDAQIPGNKLVLTVQRILSNGLQVSFNEDNIGYINRIYLEKPLESYEEGQEIHGILMYVMQTVKFAYFTLLSSDENKERLNIGDTFEKAKVSFVGAKGVVMKLKKGIRGVVPFSRTEVAYEKISSKFAIDTTHKCRVMAYDLFEQIYICTMESKLLNEKHFASSNLEPGERLSVTIAKIQPETGYLMVTAGRTKGWVPPEHIIDPEVSEKNHIKVGNVVEARVLGRDKKDRGVLFTLKKSLVESTLPILRDIREAKVGAKHDGTIVYITDKGILVRFYGGIKGWISARTLNPKTASNRWNYLIGQVITVRIESVEPEEDKLTLRIHAKNKDAKEETNFEIGESVEGNVVESSIEGVYIRILKNNEDESKTAFLPAGHMSPCQEIGSYLSARCTNDEKISALVFSTEPRFLLTRTFVPQETYRKFETLSIGDCLPCSVHEINQDGLKLILPIKGYNSYGTVTRYNVDNFDSLYTNQILFARIISIDRKKRKIGLDASLHGIWKNKSSEPDNDLIGSVDALTLYLNKLRELSDHDYYKLKPISKVQIGERVTARVEKVTDHGLVLQMDNDVQGTVRKDHYRGNVKTGDIVKGTILWINYIHELAEITLLPNIMNSISAKQSKSINIPIETQLRADIVLITNWFVLVVLKGAGKGLLAALPTKRHVNDTEPNLKGYTIGKRIRCYVVLKKTETNLIPICLIKSSFETEKITTSPAKKNLKRKSTNDDEHAVKRMKQEVVDVPEEKSAKKKKKGKTKKNNTKTETTSEESEFQVVNKDLEEKSTKKRKLDTEKTNLESKTSVSVRTKMEKTNLKNPKGGKVNNRETKKKNQDDEPKHLEEIYSESDDDKTSEETPGIPECGFFWDNRPDDSLVAKDESSSDDDHDENETNEKKKKKKKLSAAERREAERQKEREIREREEALASNEAPNSVDQFDRLVLSSPDSSMIWLQYMAYHLQATEIDKARAVAKRAIKTINFREETERLNVWQAWLNLESRFGTLESLENVFKEAVQTNDARSIYLHMLTVHADAGRQSELEKIVTTILGKFKQIADVWYQCGNAFLKLGLKEKSRHVMQRALQSLPPQEHVNLMVKFAQMENKYGDKERAQTLFEQVLSSYPKRVDVWSSYVDSLVKSENIDEARKVLEKAIVQTLPARKMKTLFKKFIDFEQKHGTPEGVSHVQQLAFNYVENECNKNSI